MIDKASIVVVVAIACFSASSAVARSDSSASRVTMLTASTRPYSPSELELRDHVVDQLLYLYQDAPAQPYFGDRLQQIEEGGSVQAQFKGCKHLRQLALEHAVVANNFCPAW
jgi:hypothetical protein